MKSLLLLPFLAISACQDAKTEAPADGPSINAEINNPISATELMKALHGSDFVVKLPDDIKPSTQVGLAFKNIDGSIDMYGSSSSFSPGDKLRVVIFTGDDQIKYSVISENGTMSGRFSLTQKGYSWSSSPRAEYQTGESLIKYSSTNSDSKQNDGDFILHVEYK